MAAKPASTKVTKTKVGDVQIKGKKTSGNKVTSQGKSRNTRKNSKDAVREKKGR